MSLKKKSKTKEKKSKTKEKKTVGAPLSLNQETIDAICALGKKGNFRQDIAKRLKILPTTFNSWLHRGKEHLREIQAGTREEMSLQAQLVVELDAAEAESRALIMEDVASCDDPRTKLAFLKLRHGRFFAQSAEAEDGDTGEVTKRSAADLLAERLSSFLEDSPK